MYDMSTRREHTGPTFDFGEAIRRIKDGASVRRVGWNGISMHIYLENGYSVDVRGGMYSGAKRRYEPVIVMYTAQETHQPGWLASQADLLAEDWYELHTVTP